MTTLLDRLRNRSTTTPTASDAHTAARTHLGPYLDDALAPWGPDVHAALDDLAVAWARRDELTDQQAAAVQAAQDAHQAAVGALASGAASPEAVHDLAGPHWANAASLAEAIDQVTREGITPTAREVVRRQSVELTDRARARHAEAAEKAADVAHLLDALQDAAGVLYVPDTLAPGVGFMGTVDRLTFEAQALSGQAVAAALVAAGAPLGSVNGQEGAAPALATITGAGHLPPLVASTASPTAEYGGVVMPYTEPDADRTRIHGEVTTAITGQPAPAPAPDGPPLEYQPPAPPGTEAGPWTPPTYSDDAQGAAAWDAAVTAEEAAQRDARSAR